MGSVTEIRGPVKLDPEEISLDVIAQLVAERYLFPLNTEVGSFLSVRSTLRMELDNCALSSAAVSRWFRYLEAGDVLFPASPELQPVVAGFSGGAYAVTQFGGFQGSIELRPVSAWSATFDCVRITRRGFCTLLKMIVSQELSGLV